MRKLLLLVLLSAAPMLAQETITLTIPETKPSNPSYRVDRIHLDSTDGVLSIYLLGVGSEGVGCHYTPTTNPTGAFLMTALNKANLSTAYAGNATTGSLKQRIYHRLVVMNEALAVCGRSLAGTITGSVP